MFGYDGFPMRQQPRAPRRFLLVEEDAPHRLICYGNSFQISRVLERRLWMLYMRQLGQHATDPLPGDGDDDRIEEPAFLGVFEPSRDKIRATVHELAREQHWDVTTQVTHTQVTCISPTGRYDAGPLHGFGRNFHGTKIGPLPDDFPDVNFKVGLNEFFKQQEAKQQPNNGE